MMELIAVLTFALGGTGPPEAYEVIDLGSVFGSHSHVFDMNETGDVVGLSYSTGFHAVPVRWQDGVTNALATFGGSISESGATDALDDGTIVGYSATPQLHAPPFDTCEIIRAFVTTDGVNLTDLGSLSSEGDSIATGLNASMQICGWSHDALGGGSLTYRAFLWQNGVMTNLGTLGGASSAAWDIDAGGRICGEARTSDGKIHAFLWERGVMTDIDTFGGNQSVARAMNEAGLVIGMWRNTFGDSPRSFAWDPDERLMTDLGDLGGGYAEAFGLNAHGAVVGTSTRADGQLSGFLWYGGTMIDLADLAPDLPAQFAGRAIDDSWRIAGGAWVGGTKRAYLLLPIVVGDFDGDGLVGFTDLVVLLSSWGRCSDCPADLDDSGAVDFPDIVELLARWDG